MSSLPPPPTGTPVDHPPPAGVEPQGGPASWEWWQGALAVLTAFMGSGVAVAIVFGIALAFGADAGDPPGGVAILGLFVQNVVFVFVVVMIAGMRGGRPAPWMFGLREPQPGWGTAVLWIVATYAVLIATGALWDLVVDIPEPEVIEDLGVTANDAAAIGGALMICVGAPITEELLFRGLLFPSLRGRIGTAAAAIVTGLVFGGVHVVGSPVEALPLLAVFGAMLCVVYLRTRSLLPCMLVHAINNAITYGLLLDWDWQIPLLMAGSLALILAANQVVKQRFGAAPLHLTPV